MKHTHLIAYIFQKSLRSNLTDFFLVAQEPSLEAALQKLQDLFLFNLSGSGLSSAQLQACLEEAQKAFEQDQRLGIAWLCPMDQEFPGGLLRLNEPPFLLRYWGRLDWMSKIPLAVVGTREPHRVSIQWMEENIAPLVQQKELVLVSGGARGVDQVAHKIALRAGKPTVCFVPSGLSRIYPQSLEDLIEPILCAGGAVISEYASDQEMRKFHFIQRNRLIAGLGISTLLVQAGRRSGTLLTAKASLEHGKPVFVVPSHPLDVKSQGGLDLLIDGASMVRDEKDLELLIDSELVGYTRDSGRTWC